MKQRRRRSREEQSDRIHSLAGAVLVVLVVSVVFIAVVVLVRIAKQKITDHRFFGSSEHLLIVDVADAVRLVEDEVDPLLDVCAAEAIRKKGRTTI